MHGPQNVKCISDYRFDFIFDYTFDYVFLVATRLYSAVMKFLAINDSFVYNY